jgi:hypothetical protein
MTLSPKVLRGGLVQVDPSTTAVLRVIPLQYNADSLSRTLQVRAAGKDGGDRSQALRLKGAAVETIRLEAEVDATDHLEDPGANPDAVVVGIHPQLAALEGLVNPTAEALARNDELAGSGQLEVLPIEAPLTLFVWSAQRVLPVRVTELAITEEAFDVNLNPIRAKVTLGLRVLSVDDLGFDHRGGTLFMGYLRSREGLARKAPTASLGDLGVEGI